VLFGLRFAEEATHFKDRWDMGPSAYLIWYEIWQVLAMLFYAVLIHLVSSGRIWARVIYAVLLVVRTVTVLLPALAVWDYLPAQTLLVAFEFTCDYVAMYWLFTEPGRRWFRR
jgi:hypothetical protein